MKILFTLVSITMIKALAYGEAKLATFKNISYTGIKSLKGTYS